MAKRNTKQLILECGLELFSVNGFEGVSVREIAKAVGIRESSLYKHYAGKQDILDAILAETQSHYDNTVQSLGIAGEDTQTLTPIYTGMNEEQLAGIGLALFTHFVTDDFTVKVRKLLTIEQYNNTHASRLYSGQYLHAPVHFQSALFESFIAQGSMRQCDPQVAALHFYSPMLLLMQQFDGGGLTMEQATQIIRNHIHQFTELYMIK
ncbi:MAG: TetR/AcrR family transcriptional regulator [Angelakisella sp.]